MGYKLRRLFEAPTIEVKLNHENPLEVVKNRTKRFATELANN